MDLSLNFGFDLGVGAPTPLASGVTFEPLQVLPTLVGNSEADDLTDEEGAPAQLEVSYVGHGGRQITKRVVFCAGLSVHHYLKQTHTTHIRTHSKLLVGEKQVRMNYVPKLGEHIRLQPARRAMS